MNTLFPIEKNSLLFRILRISSILAVVFLFSLPGCKKKPGESVENPYVFTNTTGLISRMDPIRVVFAQKMVDSKAVGSYLQKGVFTVAPAVDGNVYWVDEKTIEFKPTQSLKSDEKYTVSVQVNKLIDNVPNEFKSYSFDVHTMQMSYSLTWNGWNTPEVSDYAHQEYNGTIFSSDVADTSQVHRLIRVSSHPLTWQDSPDGLSHHFTIRDIQRSEKENQLDIELSADISTAGSNTYSLKVPAINDFQVHDVYPSMNEDFYFTINFSDPIDRAQDLSGLIKIEGYLETLRAEVNGNNIIVYPASRITGKRTVTVDPSVRNSMGIPLNKPWSKEVTFEDNKPKVRFIKRGNILPESDGLILPFEAINLSAVDVEVVKIFSNNILQYYQTFDGNESNYEINRVGRIILQQKVVLSTLNSTANNDRWISYGLDLDKLIATDKNAIYQIRIGFRRAYSMYNCQDSTVEESAESKLQPMASSFNEPVKSIYDDNYYGFGDNESYEWSNRDNPCKNEYYNQEHFAIQSVYKSNIGLIAKGGETGEFFVAATDLISADRLPGVDLKFFDFQQQLITSVTTDNDGFARVKLDRAPFILVGSKGNDKSFLRIQDGDALSMSKFDVSGENTQRGLKAYIYGERAVWRPGDSIFLNAIISDQTASLPAGHPVMLTVSDPNGMVSFTHRYLYTPGAIIPMKFKTGSEAPTGTWYAKLTIGSAEFSKALQIETIKPNKLKIQITPNQTQLNSGGGTVSTNLLAEWLTGPPAAGMNAHVDAFLQLNPVPFKKYPEYKFSGMNYTSTEARVFDGSLDAGGKAHFAMNLNPNNDVNNLSTLVLKTTVMEPGGNTSIDYFTSTYSPFDAYVGIRGPKDSWGEPVISKNDNSRFDLVTLDGAGRAVANKNISVSVYRAEWRWWWDGDDNDAYYYNSDVNLSPVKEQQVKSDGTGKASFTFNPVEWGRYYVKAVLANGHTSGMFVYAGYPEGTDEETLASMVTSLKINIQSKEVTAGNPIELSFEGIPDGKALISLESEKGIIQAKWYDIKAGLNRLKIPTNKGMNSTVYAFVTLIQPHGHTTNDLPIRQYGVIPIQITNPDFKLLPTIGMADEIKPDEPVAMTVSENSGKAMNYTIDIVDEGLLSLTRFKTPDPYRFFNAKSALSVKTWDLFDEVIGAYGGKISGTFAIGGDMAAQQLQGAPKANRFKPAIVHLGPFSLAKGQKAKHIFSIENYVGEVRVMVVACNQDTYGSAEKTVKVRKPLMISTTLPRTLAPGDEFNLPVTVFANKPEIKNVSVSFNDQNGLIVPAGNATTSVKFDKIGDKMVYIPVKVNSAEGVAKLRVAAASGVVKSFEDIEIQVSNPNPYLTKSKSLTLAGGKSGVIQSDAPGSSGSNKAILTISAFTPINLSERLDYLITYPYGCLEQTVSAAFPQLYLSDFVSLNEEGKSRIRRNILDAINKIALFQLPGGGFSYWPGLSSIDQYTSCYAGQFLIEAQKAGYVVNPTLLNAWKNYQKNAANTWSRKQANLGFYNDYNDLTQANRLNTLVLAGTPELGAMNQLKNYKEASYRTKWLLALAYAQLGKTGAVKELMTDAGKDIKPYAESGYGFGSDLSDQSLLLELYLLLNDRIKADQAAKLLAGKLNSENWYSTYSLANSLRAISLYLNKYPVAKSINAAYTFKGKVVNVTEKGSAITIDLGRINNVNDLKVSNKGTGTLYFTLTHSGKPSGVDRSVQASNMEMSVRYLDRNNRPIEMNKLAKGTEFVAEVHIKHKYPESDIVREVALNQIFPAGWEIINDRFQSGISQQNNYIEYQDFRDDRVHSFFNLMINREVVVRVKLLAAYQGSFYLPPVTCAAMYNDQIKARIPGQRVQVY